MSVLVIECIEQVEWKIKPVLFLSDSYYSFVGELNLQDLYC